MPFHAHEQPGQQTVAPEFHLRAYYERLWGETSRTWREGVQPVSMHDGQPVPVDFCLSTVVRLISHPNFCAGPIEDLIAELRAVAPGQFYYPNFSQHVTLLGCTQRFSNRAVFSEERMAAVAGVCRTILQDQASTSIRFRGAGLSGAQVFVQGYCDRVWPSLRSGLGEALTRLGERPMTYPNKWPCHCNLMRCTSGNPKEIAAILDVLERSREAVFGTLTITTVELLLTDFVLSEPGTDFVARFELKP